MLFLTFISLFGLTHFASPSPNIELFNLEEADSIFEEFIIKYNRKYKDKDEKNIRFEIFKQRLIFINQYNIENEEAILGITPFTDNTEEEMLARSSCLGSGLDEAKCPISSERVDAHPAVAVAEQWDWRDQGVVSPIKDQGTKCGSCWAHSAIANVESQWAIKHRDILDLSEQELVDCSDLSQPCEGAESLSDGFGAIIRLGGVEAEADYPYVGFQQKCEFSKSKVKVNVSACMGFKMSDEENEVRATLQERGPLTIGMFVHNDVWATYKNGIMKNCPKGEQGHALLLVGYGTENETPYWILKNSWGLDWGEQGYIRVQRDGNTCSMLDTPLILSSVA